MPPDRSYAATPVPLLAACSLVAPGLPSARAEKAVLRMIAAEIANFVMVDIAHLLRLFAAAL
jgi:hypothetical protein